MESFLDATFVTTTAYGSWLPGDVRGYVERREILPGSIRLERYARSIMTTDPVVFQVHERESLGKSLKAACEEFGYFLSDAAIEATHIHWLVSHDDPIPRMVARLKARMRQALARGRIWTKGYCARSLSNHTQLIDARNYIGRHTGTYWIEGSKAPGSTGG